MADDRTGAVPSSDELLDLLGRGLPREVVAAAAGHDLDGLEASHVAHYVVGRALDDTGDRAAAIEHLERALALARRAEDDHFLGLAAWTLGAWAEADGDHQAAEERFRDSFRALAGGEDATAVAVAFVHNAGLARGADGAAAAALDVLERDPRAVDVAVHQLIHEMAGPRSQEAATMGTVAILDRLAATRLEGADDRWMLMWHAADVAARAGADGVEDRWIAVAAAAEPVGRWSEVADSVWAAWRTDRTVVESRVGELVPLLRRTRRALLLDTRAQSKGLASVVEVGDLLLALISTLDDGHPLLDAEGLDALEAGCRLQRLGRSRDGLGALAQGLASERDPDGRRLLEVEMISLEFDLHELASAAERCERLRRWAEDELPPADVANLIERHGGIMQGLNRQEDAIVLLSEAVRRYTELHGPDSVVTAFAQVNLAVPLHTVGRDEEAADLLDRAGLILEPLEGEEDHGGRFHLYARTRAMILLNEGSSEARSWIERAERAGGRTEADGLRMRMWRQALDDGNEVLDLAELRQRLDELDELGATNVDRADGPTSLGEIHLVAASVVVRHLPGPGVELIEVAEDHAEQAVLCFEEAGDEVSLAHALTVQAQLLGALLRIPEALTAALEAVELFDQQRYHYRWEQWRAHWLESHTEARYAAMKLAVVDGRPEVLAWLIESARLQTLPVLVDLPSIAADGWPTDRTAGGEQLLEEGFSPLARPPAIGLHAPTSVEAADA